MSQIFDKVLNTPLTLNMFSILCDNLKDLLDFCNMVVSSENLNLYADFLAGNNYLPKVNPFSPSTAFHIKTSYLVYCVNQMTGLYIKRNGLISERKDKCCAGFVLN